MTTTAWISWYFVNGIFWIWVIRWGGAEKLEGSFTSGFLISFLTPNWSAEGIKLFGWLTLMGSTLWFLTGLFVPNLRF